MMLCLIKPRNETARRSYAIASDLVCSNWFLPHTSSTTDSEASDPDTLLVETERIRSVFQQAPLVFPVTVINAVLTAVVLHPVVSHKLLWIWVAMIFAVSGMRWAIRQRFLRHWITDDTDG